MPSPSNDLNSRSPLDELGFGNFATVTTLPTKTRCHRRQSQSLILPTSCQMPKIQPPPPARRGGAPHKDTAPPFLSGQESRQRQVHKVGLRACRGQPPNGGDTTTDAKGGGPNYWEEKVEASPHASILPPPTLFAMAGCCDASCCVVFASASTSCPLTHDAAS